MPHLLLLQAALAAKTTTKSSSSSTFPLIIIVVLFAAAYFLFLRPRSKRARQQQTSSTNLSVGDEVISAGGILGTVTAIAGDEISVEVSPGSTLTFWRRAINLRTAVKGAPQSSAASTVDDDAYEDETAYENYDEDPADDGATRGYRPPGGYETPAEAPDSGDTQATDGGAGGTHEISGGDTSEGQTGGEPAGEADGELGHDGHDREPGGSAGGSSGDR